MATLFLHPLQVAGRTYLGPLSVPVATVTAVDVFPSSVTLAGGSTQQLSAVVTGANSPSQAVTWTCNGGIVNSSGLFTAPSATRNVQVITVTATSNVDGSKIGIATITINALPAAQTGLKITFRKMLC